MKTLMQLDFGFRTPSSNPPLAYIGAKRKLYRQVMDILPDGTKELVSPFMGGASLELKIAASGIRVHAYDIFRPLVEFYQVFNGRSSEVVEAVLELYPLSREDYIHMTRGGGWEVEECEVWRAALTWAISKQSFLGRMFASLCVAQEHNVLPSYFSDEQWQGWRNPNISFDVADFRESLARHPDTIAYLDPPYISKENYYGRGNQGEFQHEELRDILAERGRFVMSYGDHPTIHELYSDFKILHPQWTYGFGRAAGDASKSEELLILSPDLDGGA